MFTEALIAFPWVVIPATITALAGLAKVIFDIIVLLKKNHRKKKLILPKT